MKSTENDKEPISYYASLTRGKSQSSKSFDDFMMAQTPQTPEELRQYMDFLKVHYRIHLDSSVLKYSRMLIKNMKEKYPKNKDIRMARRTLRSVTISTIIKKGLFIIGISLLYIVVFAGYRQFQDEHPTLFAIDNAFHHITHFFWRLLHFFFHLFL